MNTLLPSAALARSAGTPFRVDACGIWDLPQTADTDVRPILPAALAAWLTQQGFPGLQARDVNGETPLMRAAGKGEDAVVASLLAHGAEPDTVNDDGNNALWFACLHGSPATIRCLIEAGVPIDHANDDDVTCLLQAAASGRLDVLRLLLAQGATADLCAPDGRSALDMAADLGLQLLRLARRIPGPYPEQGAASAGKTP